MDAPATPELIQQRYFEQLRAQVQQRYREAKAKRREAALETRPRKK